MASAKNATSTSSHQQSRMGVMTKVAAVHMSILMILEHVLNVKLILIHQQTARHVKRNAKLTIRLSKKMVIVKHVKLTLIQTHKKTRENVNLRNVMMQDHLQLRNT